jgi:hypothetical protein
MGPLERAGARLFEMERGLSFGSGSAPSSSAYSTASTACVVLSLCQRDLSSRCVKERSLLKRISSARACGVPSPKTGRCLVRRRHTKTARTDSHGSGGAKSHAARTPMVPSSPYAFTHLRITQHASRITHHASTHHASRITRIATTVGEAKRTMKTAARRSSRPGRSRLHRWRSRRGRRCGGAFLAAFGVRSNRLRASG